MSVMVIVIAVTPLSAVLHGGCATMPSFRYGACHAYSARAPAAMIGPRQRAISLTTSCRR